MMRNKKKETPTQQSLYPHLKCIFIITTPNENENVHITLVFTVSKK